MIAKLSGLIYKFIDKIYAFAIKFEDTKNKPLENIAIILYPILFLFVAVFHEPWFDEAQAWQIAKCASYQDIFFYLPHLEAHPPFWHLFLSIFAKNNFPYEITIKTISFVFSYFSAILIILKSPFLRIIRILLPFNYFLFYQYGIISRPYCLIMLAFIILAINFYKKDEKPLFYVLGLVFLSLTHVYGLIFASIMTLTWFIFSIKNKNFTDKKILSFLFLGFFYILLIACIFPSKDAYALNTVNQNSIVLRLFYTFFVVPSECFISNIFNTIDFLNFSSFSLALGFFGSSLIMFLICYYINKKKEIFLTFLLSYVVFSIISAKYLCVQHIGILFCFLIFIFWITIFCFKKEAISIKNNIVKKYLIFIVAISLFTGFYWNFKSCILDVLIPYSKGRKEAKFIKKYNLDKYNIMSDWKEDTIDNVDNLPNPNVNMTWLAIAPYFEKNIISNFNTKNPEINYLINRNLKLSEINEIYSSWKKLPLPDVLLGNPSLAIIFDNINVDERYIPVYHDKTAHVQKGVLLYNDFVTIRVEKRLAQKLNLKEIELEFVNYKFDCIQLISSLLQKRIYKFQNNEKKG